MDQWVTLESKIAQAQEVFADKMSSYDRYYVPRSQKKPRISKKRKRRMKKINNNFVIEIFEEE